MNSQGPPSRAQSSHSRGHRPHRGARGSARATRGGPGGSSHANHHRGGGRGGNHHSSAPFTPLSDPSQDPQLAPRPPREGFFHASFVENPWYELEEKMGIPHINPVVPQRNASTKDESQADLTTQKLTTETQEVVEQTPQAEP